MTARYGARKGCLPCGANPEAKCKPSSFEPNEPAWKAGDHRFLLKSKLPRYCSAPFSQRLKQAIANG